MLIQSVFIEKLVLIKPVYWKLGIKGERGMGTALKELTDQRSITIKK